MKITALIMAGGKGERFWPRSRKQYPKQFLDIVGCGKTMLQLTVERILPLIATEDIFVVTNEEYKEIVFLQLPDIPKRNILCEPKGKNTAPCIGLGAIHILKRNKDSVVLVLAADHLINEEREFRKCIEKAVKVAKQGKSIVTIGIVPNRPETNYGYIKRNIALDDEDIVQVEKFIEKPGLQKAIQYWQSGDYLWNSGIFIWKASTIMEMLKQYVPDIYEHIQKINDKIGTTDEYKTLTKEFSSMPSVSVDYGIMEHAENVYVIPGDFGWDDVGSWLALERIRDMDEEKNIISGNVIVTETKNCIIDAGKKLIATVNLENIIIIDSDDVTLVGNKDKIGNIKNVLEIIRDKNWGDKYL